MALPRREQQVVRLQYPFRCLLHSPASSESPPHLSLPTSSWYNTHPLAPSPVQTLCALSQSYILFMKRWRGPGNVFTSSLAPRSKANSMAAVMAVNAAWTDSMSFYEEGRLDIWKQPDSFLGRQAAVAISWRSLVAMRAEERDAWWTLSFSRLSKVSRFKNILGSYCYHYECFFGNRIAPSPFVRGSGHASISMAWELHATEPNMVHSDPPLVMDYKFQWSPISSKDYITIFFEFLPAQCM